MQSMQVFINTLKHMQHHAQYCLDSKKVNPNNMPDVAYYVEDKEDGVYGNVVCIKENNQPWNTVRCFSRDGNLLSNTQWTEREFRNCSEGVYIAEFTIDNGVFEDCSRFYNPNVVNQLDLKHGQRSTLKLYDHVSVAEFLAGKCSDSVNTRKNRLLWNFEQYFMDSQQIELLEHDICFTYKEAFDLAHYLMGLHPNSEGSVIKKSAASWKRGARDENYIKVVRYGFYDLRVVGFEEGKGKHSGAVGKLKLEWHLFGKVECAKVIVPADGMISYELRRQWWVQYQNGNCPIIGAIAKIRSKGLTNKGNLRQAKYIEMRWDKTLSEFE